MILQNPSTPQSDKMMLMQDLLAIEQRLLGGNDKHLHLLPVYRRLGDVSRAFRDMDTAWAQYEKAVECVANATKTQQGRGLDEEHLLLCESMKKVRPSKVLDEKIEGLQLKIFGEHSIQATQTYITKAI